MEETDKKPPESTLNTDEYIDGVKIQKLPTIGSPMTIKGTRWRGNYATTRIRGGTKRQVKAIARAIKD